jgi:hypothetical protein
LSAEISSRLRRSDATISLYASRSASISVSDAAEAVAASNSTGSRRPLPAARTARVNRVSGRARIERPRCWKIIHRMAVFRTAATTIRVIRHCRRSATVRGEAAIATRPTRSSPTACR